MQMEVKRNMVRDKALLTLLCFVFSPLWSLAQRDLILLRDGSERKVKIIMVNSDQIVYSSDAKSVKQETINNNVVYMIKYEKRGNIFFMEDGERVSGEGDGRIPSNATVIYLLKGEEIVGYNVELDVSSVKYTASKKKGKEIFTIDKSQIFLIVYPDGTKEMLNDFETLRKQKEAALAEQRRLAEEARLEELRKSYPKTAIIKTIKNLTIKVSLLTENEQKVTYKRSEQKNSPVYHMDRTNIKDIIYND